MEYKLSNSCDAYSYGKRDEMQKSSVNESEPMEAPDESDFINNLCLSQAIEESLENLVRLTSNPDFKFIEQPPSQIITFFISQLRLFPSKQKIIYLCVCFVGNVWYIYGNSMPMFIDETLLELIIMLCLQKDLPKISLCSIISLNKLLSATTQDDDQNFKVENLENLLFHPVPDSKGIKIDTSNLSKLLSLLDPKSEICNASLQLIFNIVRTYKNTEICSTIINDANFLALLMNPEKQISIFQIICKLADDNDCFGLIFNRNFAQSFVNYLISINDPNMILLMYSTLTQFMFHDLIDQLDTKEFWDSLKKNLNAMFDLNLTNILQFVDKVTLLYPKLLEKYDFWPKIFELSDKFSIENKEGFAIILCTYFDNSSIGNINQPPLSYAINNGFEFLSDILEYVQNPMLFHNILLCLLNLLIKQPEIFGPIISRTDLIQKLRDISLNHDDENNKKSFYRSTHYEKGLFDEQDDQNDINSLIDYFISTAVAFCRS